MCGSIGTADELIINLPCLKHSGTIVCPNTLKTGWGCWVCRIEVFLEFPQLQAIPEFDGSILCMLAGKEIIGLRFSD
jgi:hypothetical protein